VTLPHDPCGASGDCGSPTDLPTRPDEIGTR